MNIEYNAQAYFICKCNVCLCLPVELNGVSNVRTTPSTIKWDQLGGGLESQCITHYRLTWAGGMYDTPNNSTSVSAAVLSSAGFPYCQTVMVTVAPEPISVVTGGSGSTMAMFQHPGDCDYLYLYYVLSLKPQI